MAECSEIAPLLGVFEDGELEPHEMQEVAHHLARCKACERALSDYAALGRHLRAAALTPSLENFTQAVERRLDQLRPPLRVRFGRRIGALGERWAAAIALASGALALGAWVLLFAPYVRHYLQTMQGTNAVAVTEHRGEIAPQEESEEGSESTLAEGSPQAVISRLQAKTPAVAVWSEPETRTTVIWLPDEP